MSKVMPKAIPAFDLTRQYHQIRAEIDAAVAGVMARGRFILDEQVARFEEEFAGYLGARYAVGVGSGTEALHLSLMALGVGAGDEVITVSHTAVPTAAAISITGARPVFVDVDPETYTMDAAQLEAAITPRTKAIMPVHLYGNVTEMTPLMKIARKYRLAVVEDACQAHGAEHKGKKVGTIGNLGTFSFYPTKNLGCYGDGGMIVTNDGALARQLRLLRFYGMADRDKYIHVIKGISSRLDEIQAAVLRVKLKYLDGWNEVRRAKAALYNRLLPQPSVLLPDEPAYARNVYHLYVIRTERRDSLRRYLARQGIGTGVHYPVPVHLQPSYADLNLGAGSLSVTERCADEVLSLPMFPELADEEIEHVAGAIQRFYQVNPDET